MVGSGLTLFSGFGLGTILTPVFALFFPIELAIIMTAIVHFLNNIFKLGLLGKFADKKIVLLFGIPSIIAAFLGAWVLTWMSKLPPFHEYELGGNQFSIMPSKVVIGILLAAFALFDIIPKFGRLEFDKKFMPLGGLLSGFFGGLSGLQGALRSAFLIRANLTKESFIATGIVIACLVDISRLSIYAGTINRSGGTIDYMLTGAATFAAFAGAFVANKFLKKITIRTVQYIVATMLLIFSILLIFGII
jgi:uncharacterized membrane protein YfcA